MVKNTQSAGTALEMLILRILDRRGPSHGYDIANVLRDWSAESIRVEEGSLYPALHRMEEAGLVAAEWTVTESKRRARTYRITRAGGKHLAGAHERWTTFTDGVARVLRHS
jgi:transcriptional regulator